MAKTFHKVHFIVSFVMNSLTAKYDFILLHIISYYYYRCITNHCYTNHLILWAKDMTYMHCLKHEFARL